MGKYVGVVITSLLLFIGVFFVLPGLMFLVLRGLMLLSYDYPSARGGFKSCQLTMSIAAHRIDRVLLTRKYRAYSIARQN